MPLLRWTKHKQIMVNILKDIYHDDLLGSTLGFKGGTAAMLFYQLSRRSVDLDFDILNTKQEEEVLVRIDRIAQKYGEVREHLIKKYTIFTLLSYGGQDANIKIEISRRGPQGEYAMQEYLGVGLLVMNKQDMFANKLIALLDRKNPVSRDIFDIWFFMQQQWDINVPLVEERTGMTFSSYCDKAAIFVENYGQQRILAGLGELINEKQKAWVKMHLLEDTAFGLRFLSENNEREG